MDALLDALMLPGKWLFDLFFFGGEAHDAAARVELAPWLTVVFWLGVALVLRGVRMAVHGRPSGALRLPRVSPADLWALVWRAQCVHLAIVVGVPLVWELGQGLLMIVFLPFFIVGFGDRTLRSGLGLEHLREPACWSFVAPCATPEAPLAALGVWWKLLWLLLTLAWCWHAWRGRRRAGRSA